MSDELVLESQRAVEHTRLPEHDGVVERAAEREPTLSEHLDLLEEPERPSRGDLIDEHLFAQPHRA